MADDKISRREFINKSSAAAGTVAVGAVAGSAHAHDAADYAQSDYSVRTKALISVLSKKGLVNQASMDAVVDFYENKVGPHIGARVVARSWVDADYRERLLADARAVAREDDLTGVQGTDLIAVENSSTVHNLVVCTLCSCYPWPLLGLPPAWYKDTAYRAQSVIDPRGVLQKFGLTLDDDVEVRVWDSTAEVRYLVIPERPAGTDGLSIDELAALVTRDSMIGAERLQSNA
ncbi:MAG: nitrile hydratase subunit alpha [Woeseiaceae bacterium]|jgi:nitrile hydratase|nr:nitrile hydratase subunit alpha [Woeseiaceae bacterium]|tara:strand:- start:451 stop:1146 length:696 start_codon:yes stop_codon:yes gene_type:complete